MHRKMRWRKKAPKAGDWACSCSRFRSNVPSGTRRTRGTSRSFAASSGPNAVQLSSAFSLLEVEKRVRGEDSDVTEKLGKLWTWDNSVRGGQYKVLPVEKILHSLPLMPRFKPNSCEYSIDKGMYENPFKLCSRERPPFDWCRCREGSAI